jgi:hypothetical protein
MTYRRRPGVATQLIDGAAALFDPTEGELITLNRTGSVLWELLEQPTSRDHLVDGLAKRHPDIPVHEVGPDVDTFLVELERRNLIVDAAD